MERYHPRAGLACALTALPVWVIFLFNGILGFFPAVIFSDGGIGSKFHFWLFVKDRLFGGSPDPVWSDAGVMTAQEWLMLLIALPLTVGALYCLRRRPEFGTINRTNMSDERELLEMSSVISNTAGTGNANTAAIIDSVIEKEASPDENVVAAALGEMGVIAAANSAEIAANTEIEEHTAEEEHIIDSRFTTVIADEESMAIASAAAKADVPVIPEISTVAEVDEDSTEDDDPFDQWPSSEQDIPEMPSTPNLSEMISETASKAASATVTAMKEVATKAVEVKDKLVEKVRPQPKTSVMPVRPPDLPPMAEWDSKLGEWMLFGRPIRIAEKAEPEPERPSWVDESTDAPPVVEDEDVSIAELDVPQSLAPVLTARRVVPTIPKLP